MKKLLLIVLIISANLPCINAFGQHGIKKRIKIQMDVALEDLIVTVNPGSYCDAPSITAKIALKNKGPRHTTVHTGLEIKVNGMVTQYTLQSPISGQSGTDPACFKLLYNQSTPIEVKIAPLRSWENQSQPVELTATAIECVDSEIIYDEVNETDNSKVIRLDLSGLRFPKTNWCICYSFGTEFMDTTSNFIIKGNVKDPRTGQVISATIAVANDLRPVLSASNAATFKLKYAGNYFPTNLPCYYIIFSNTFLTVEEDILRFSITQEGPRQLWIFKKNTNGSYTILNPYMAPEKACQIMGSPSNRIPAPDSYLTSRRHFEIDGIYFQFQLFKIQ